MAPTGIPTPMTALDAAADYLEWPLIVAATMGALAFLITYTALADWWRSREGRHMFALTLGLAALGGVSVMRRAIGEWPYYDVTITVIYGLLAWELWRRVWLLLTAQGVIGRHCSDQKEDRNA